MPIDDGYHNKRDSTQSQWQNYCWNGWKVIKIYGGIIKCINICWPICGVFFITIGWKQLSVTQQMSKGVPQVSNKNPKEEIQLSRQFIQIMLGNLSLQPSEKKNARGHARPRNRWGGGVAGSRWGLQDNRAETYRFIADGMKNYLL